MALNIRLANRADMGAMIPVINAAFSIEEFMDGTRTDVERLDPMFDTGEFLVGFEGDALVASIYTETREDERGYFGMLSVDPAQQGKGYGRIMVEAAEDHLRRRGAKVVDIMVLNLRTELPPFYRKLGYVETGIEEFRPSRPMKSGVECHGIIMTKEL